MATWKCLLLCLMLLTAQQASSIRTLNWPQISINDVPLARETADKLGKWGDEGKKVLKKGEELADTVIRPASEAFDEFGTALDQAGAIVDKGRAIIADPGGTIRREVLNRVQDVITDALASVSTYELMKCTLHVVQCQHCRASATHMLGALPH